MRKSLFGHPKGSKSSRVAQPRLALAAAIARRKLAMNCSESKSGYQPGRSCIFRRAASRISLGNASRRFQLSSAKTVLRRCIR
jgi:hypothetical protein